MENKQQEKGVFDQVDILSMVKDVLRQWWVILICSAAVSLLANVYVNYTYVPQYTVSTTFAVTAKGMNNNIYQNLSTTISMADEMKMILNSSLLKKKVAKDLGISSFPATTDCAVVDQTNMMKLSVTAGSAMEAYKIMKSILANYTEVSDYVIANVILEEIQSPTIPTGVSNPLNTRRPMKMAALIMAALLIAFFAVISYMKDTVKNESEVREKIDTHFLGSVYHENKKRGVKNNKHQSMLITNRFLSFRFIEANKMVASRIRSQMEKHKCKAIMVTSVMENEGKSTVAANIALSLAQENKKVLLIDFDFRKPAQYKIFGQSKDDCANLPEILKTQTGFNAMIKKDMEYTLYTLFNATPSFSMEEYIGTPVFHKVMEFCKDKMDYVIVDTSPMALVSDTEEIAQLCEGSILVVRQDFVICKDINDAIDTLNRTKARVLGCVYNNVRTGLVTGAGHYGYGGHYGKYGK